MTEILEFQGKTDLNELMNRLIEEYEELEDQLFDLEDFMPDEDDKKELALWQEEYMLLNERLDKLHKEIVAIQEKSE